MHKGLDTYAILYLPIPVLGLQIQPHFEGISIDLTTSPKSKFPWTTFGLLPQILTWVSILFLIM